MTTGRQSFNRCVLWISANILAMSADSKPAGICAAGSTSVFLFFCHHIFHTSNTEAKASTLCIDMTKNQLQILMLMLMLEYRFFGQRVISCLHHLQRRDGVFLKYTNKDKLSINHTANQSSPIINPGCFPVLQPLYRKLVYTRLSECFRLLIRSSNENRMGAPILPTIQKIVYQISRNRGIIRTACPNCGSWFKDNLDHIIQAKGPKISPIDCYPPCQIQDCERNLNFMVRQPLELHSCRLIASQRKLPEPLNRSIQISEQQQIPAKQPSRMVATYATLRFSPVQKQSWLHL